MGRTSGAGETATPAMTHDVQSQIRSPNFTLPESAPLIRITAGAGSAGQKTWNIRRPVTLIGSRRPAHIVLHDRHISAAHCVIVNTGSEVLLKDLHSRGGTLCNKEAVDIAILQDGDVLRVGSMNIQVAIRVPENGNGDSGAGIQYRDPTQFDHPIGLELVHTEHVWRVSDAVALIGKHELAPIRLDHDNVARRHALIFRMNNQPAIFDLGSREGIWVDGQRCSLSPLANNSRVTIGPFGINIEFGKKPEPAASAPPPTTAGSGFPISGQSGDGHAPHRIGDQAAEELALLQDEISRTWDQLNGWRAGSSDEEVKQTSTATAHGSAADEGPNLDLTARSAELDARDAALRGRLHDLDRLENDLHEREEALLRQAAELQRRKDQLLRDQKEWNEKIGKFSERDEELRRREQAINQRWSRIRSLTCPGCGESMHAGQLNE